MATLTWTESDTVHARQIWADYQSEHDLFDREGQTAGIDPSTAQIWFGSSMQDVVAQRDAAGLSSPLFFERVGSKTYFRKGGRR